MVESAGQEAECDGKGSHHRGLPEKDFWVDGTMPSIAESQFFKAALLFTNMNRWLPDFPS
jgi:hypothetical protein